MKTKKYLAAIVLFIGVSTAKAAPADLHTAINSVIKSYLGIKNALASDNGTAASNDAKKFTAVLEQVPVALMDEKQKSAWTKYAEKLRYNGEHIGESTAIAHQREHFGDLSADLYVVVKAFQTNDMVLYRQYCPMEKKSWLSESSTIKNPYFGKKMAECGLIKETLKTSPR